MTEEYTQLRITYRVMLYEDGFTTVDPWGRTSPIRPMHELNRTIAVFNSLNLAYIVEDTVTNEEADVQQG